MVILWTFQTQDLSTLVHLRLVAGHKRGTNFRKINKLCYFEPSFIELAIEQSDWLTLVEITLIVA